MIRCLGVRWQGNEPPDCEKSKLKETIDSIILIFLYIYII